MNISIKYFNGIRTYLKVCVIIIASIGMLSCGTGPDSNQEEPIETPEHAEIALSFSNGGGSLKASGPGVESTWDSELGIVSITMNKSLDGTLDLYGSLNLTITGFWSGPKRIPISKTIISTSKCLICEPGEQINGKLYTRAEAHAISSTGCDALDEPFIVTDSFIQAENICIEMVDSESGEEVQVTGSFTAIDESSRYFNQ